jgi:Zn-dependent M28 family amino/carboxypeptidase
LRLCKDVREIRIFRDKIRKWIDSGKEVLARMQIEGKLESNLWSQNVIGTLAGSALSNEEVVVYAHCDCAANSVGADDNASGAETMFRVATRLVNEETQKTIKFIGFGAEEPSMLGSMYCVNDLKE